MSHNTRKINRLLIIGGILAIAVILILRAAGSSQPAGGQKLAGLAATVYRTATCGCCANYVAYLRRAGLQVAEERVTDLDAVKAQFNIPPQLNSCHTTRIGNYTVEGHIPLEAIEKLMAEKPAVAGIGLGGMPSGSPGMPGAKRVPFEIDSFTADGATTRFVSL